MRFLVDECTGTAVARWLRGQGHEVFSVFDEARGASDDDILRKAVAEDWILITNDKDFGELTFRQGKLSIGVILIRVKGQKTGDKVKLMKKALKDHADRLSNHFVVLTRTKLRFIRMEVIK